MIGIVKYRVVAICYAVDVAGEIVEANLDQHLIGKHRTQVVKIGDTVEMRPPCAGSVFKTPFIFRKLDGDGTARAQSNNHAVGEIQVNSFEKAIQYYGLNSDSQGEHGFIHALFVYGAGDYEGADTYSNPAREIYRRLEARGVNQHVLAKVQAFLNEYSNKVEAGRPV